MTCKREKPFLPAVAGVCYRALGFDVHFAGEHPGIGTHNALISFGQHYVELLSIRDQSGAEGNAVTGELLSFLTKHEAGLTMYSLSTTAIQHEAERIRQSHLAALGPFSLSREQPDGQVLTWSLLLPIWNNTHWCQPYPFFIQWETPNEQLLSWEKPVSHVVSSIQFVRSQHLPVAVCGGGHSYAGKGTCDDGLVIDLSPMKRVQVDPVKRIAQAQAGLLLGEYIRETEAFGLVTPVGIFSDTGLSGLTLGGGLDLLMGKYGLTIDNVLAVEIVTADGQVLRASANEHPDLFWAVKGVLF